ncbi:threonine aldolase family protein [Nocardia niwae]|uniref:threonine aldolase family protein n=1 Tax=Nocardia niwae TaxID=626084 RepID=UPI00340B5020
MSDSAPEPDHEGEPLRGFASDNNASVHPDIMAALTAANVGHQPAYGADLHTARLRELIKDYFGERAEVYPVFNGSGANVVGLQAMCDRWSAVICPESAHINLDECGAPEKVAGLKVIPVPTRDGKLTPELLDRHAWGFGDEHHAQPKVVSLTQSTELGTLYTPEEIATIGALAHERDMLLHVDGARLANAAAALGLPPHAFTTDAGVDVLSFGGTKNGLMFGEAIVVLEPDAVRGMPYLRKAALQLASKMRYVSAQFVALLEGDLWLRNARHANAMAARLATAVARVPGVEIVRPVQANAVFAVLPREVTERLRKRFRFYIWDERTGEVRWMCSFDTTEADVDAFATAIAQEMAAQRPAHSER